MKICDSANYQSPAVLLSDLSVCVANLQNFYCHEDAETPRITTLRNPIYINSPL